MRGVAPVAATVPAEGSVPAQVALDLASAPALVDREPVNGPVVVGRLNCPRCPDLVIAPAAAVRELGTVPVAGVPALANAPARAAQGSPTGPRVPLSVPIVMSDARVCGSGSRSAPINYPLAAIAITTVGINGRTGTTGITPTMAIGTMVTGTGIGNQEVIGTIGGITTRR